MGRTDSPFFCSYWVYDFRAAAHSGNQLLGSFIERFFSRQNMFHRALQTAPFSLHFNHLGFFNRIRGRQFLGQPFMDHNLFCCGRVCFLLPTLERNSGNI